VTNEPSGTQTGSGVSGPPARPLTFSKANRILKPADFRKVYNEGFRHGGTCFVAFCRQEPEGGGPRIGFTAPRALGKAHARNRMKRRVRECLRRNLHLLNSSWWIVVNLRRPAEEAPWAQIEKEVGRLVQRCQG
jgi:ribonuclease P protein component